MDGRQAFDRTYTSTAKFHIFARSDSTSSLVSATGQVRLKQTSLDVLSILTTYRAHLVPAKSYLPDVINVAAHHALQANMYKTI